MVSLARHQMGLSEGEQTIDARIGVACLNDLRERSLQQRSRIRGRPTKDVCLAEENSRAREQQWDVPGLALLHRGLEAGDGLLDLPLEQVGAARAPVRDDQAPGLIHRLPEAE